MIEWWDSREPRERLLIVIAAILLGCALLYQFVLGPAIVGNEDARRAHLRAMQALEVVISEKQIIESRQATSGAAPQRGMLSGPPLRAGLTGLATQRGIEVSRLQTTANDGFSISMENVDPKLFFTWLGEVEGMFGVRVQTVSISPSAGGSLRVTIDFSEARP